MMRFSLVTLVTAGLLAAGGAQAQDVSPEGLHLLHPFATPTPPSVPHGAAYLSISVEDDTPAVLVGARTPVSESVEIHDMSMDDGIMRMRRIEQLEVEPGTTQVMRPGGGYHLMLMNLVSPLQAGERFPLTLEFAHRGDIEVEVDVQAPPEDSSMSMEHAQH
ncbi:copper chaperone PCu(A)C [Vreelandella zhuhanensis]|nr:copper chaperone PCu(A)C [Halomonas zhuhanensis]